MGESRSTGTLETLEVPDRPAVAARPTALRRWGPPAALLATTILTTTFCGAFWALPRLAAFVTDLPALWRAHEVGTVLAAGLPFSVTLLAILLSHEFGHFFAARHHRVDATPPYFIPMPLLIGTMGAVIRMRGRVPSRRALLDIGASGPLAGFVVAVPALVWGLAHGEFRHVAAPPPGLPSGSALAMLHDLFTGGRAVAEFEVLPGNGLLFSLLRHMLAGSVPAGSAYVPHPVGMAAFFGLFVTALNLLPVGQLDGGHILYAALGGRAAKRLGRAVVPVLVVLGLFLWMGWLIWAGLAWKVVGTGHPPVVAPEEPLDARRRLVAWASLAVLVLTFAPVPLSVL